MRKDCAFAEKQQPQAARLLVVQSGHISLTPAYMTYAQLLARAPEGAGFAFADESLSSSAREEARRSSILTLGRTEPTVRDTRIPVLARRARCQADPKRVAPKISTAVAALTNSAGARS